MKASGVYEILNTVTGRRYIGSAVCLSAREKQHFSALRRNKHHNIKLQQSFFKHGASAFKFLPILTCSKRMLFFYEQQLLDKVSPEYNLSPTAGTPLGVKHSAASRANMSAAHKGRGQTRAVLQKMSDTLRGRAMPLAQRDKIRAAHLGKKMSPSAVEKSARARKGRKLSSEHREKLRLSLLGNTYAKGGKGRTLSDVHRARIKMSARARNNLPVVDIVL